MARAQTKAKDLRGPSIYQGEKPGTLFYDIFCKEAYIIQNSDAYKYDDYLTYLVIGIILAVCAGLYGKFHFLITLGLVLLVVATGRIVFQKKCLDNCVSIEYKPQKKELFLKTWSKEIKTKNLIIIIALSILMLVMCIFNVYKFAQDDFIRTGYILMSVGTAVFLICVIISLIMKLKNKSLQ
ncbi:MAG: hypothetical protein IJI44_00370 [Erysipelotrichaceae bacterium]|nr:hypothetical protein [Erysipelotrichaceae bacterium]